LGFSYLAQCRCDPAGTPQYFTYLTTIIQQLQKFGNCFPQLQELLAMERSRERFTSEDIATAATTLGFGIGNVLNVEYKEDVEDQLVENAWKESVKRS
jgi:ubiquitin carboxyl-terminal hydrolase 25/28